MTGANAPEESLWRRNPGILLCLLLLVATFSVYSQVGDHAFVSWDDPLYVTENEQVQKGLSREGLSWALTTTHMGSWHPLTWLSHMLDCELYGLNPGGHHLTNLLLHAANTLLLFLMLARMTGALWRSFIVAALFALHPLHVESVAWVAERKDVLCTLFWMLTLWAYTGYVAQPAVGRYLLTLLLFALGLMAKPMLVTLPCVLLLLDYWPLGRLQPAQTNGANGSQVIDSHGPPVQGWLVLRLVLEKTPFFVLTAISSLVTLVGQRHSGATKSLELYPIADRLANALVSYVTYLFEMVWPRKLAVFYPHPGDSLSGWQVMGAGILLLGVSLLVVGAARRFPYFLVGWFWYLGTLVPVIGLVQVGEQALADRYSYVPLIGLFIMLAWSVPDRLAKRSYAKIVLPLAAAGVLTSLMIVSWLQVRHWRNDTALYEHALAVTENNYLANNNLGGALQEDGKIEEAILHYAEAIRIKPDYANAHYNMGVALAGQGRLDEAVRHYSEALRFNPDVAEVHNNMGVALAGQGRLDEAVRHYSEALLLNPDDAEIYINMGNALAAQGKPQDAIEHYAEALRLDPNLGGAHAKLGTLLARQGRMDEAVRHYSEALRLDPDDAKVHNNLGNILARQGKLQDAIEHYSEAVRLQPDFGKAHFNLCALLARQGGTHEAIACFSSALQRKPNFADAHNSLGVLLASTGRTEEAIHHFREALRLEPNHVRARSNLEKVLQAEGS